MRTIVLGIVGIGLAVTLAMRGSDVLPEVLSATDGPSRTPAPSRPPLPTAPPDLTPSAAPGTEPGSVLTARPRPPRCAADQAATSAPPTCTPVGR